MQPSRELATYVGLRLASIIFDSIKATKEDKKRHQWERSVSDCNFSAPTYEGEWHVHFLAIRPSNWHPPLVHVPAPQPLPLILRLLHRLNLLHIHHSFSHVPPSPPLPPPPPTSSQPFFTPPLLNLHLLHHLLLPYSFSSTFYSSSDFLYSTTTWFSTSTSPSTSNSSFTPLPPILNDRLLLLPLGEGHKGCLNADRPKWYCTKWHGQNGTDKWHEQNGSNFYRFQFNWIEFLFSNYKSQISDKPKWV